MDLPLESRPWICRYLEQLIDSEQTACLGMLLKYAVEHLVDGKRTIAEVVVQLQKELETPACVFWQKNGIGFRRLCHAARCRRCIPGFNRYGV